MYMYICVYIYSNLYIQGNSSSKVDLFLMLETHGETHTLLTEIFMEAALHGLQHMMSEVEHLLQLRMINIILHVFVNKSPHLCVDQLNFLCIGRRDQRTLQQM